MEDRILSVLPFMLKRKEGTNYVYLLKFTCKILGKKQDMDKFLEIRDAISGDKGC